MTTSDDSTPLKRCGKGDNCVHPMGCWQPSNAEYFHKSKLERDGLKSWCKECTSAYKRQYRAKNVERIRESNQRYRAENAERIRERTRRYILENREKVNEDRRRYEAANPEKKRERRRRYRAANVEQERERNRRYYAENTERESERKRQYRIANPDQIREIHRRYRVQNAEKVRANNRRRRALKRNLPATFTAEHERLALEYFHNCCAVCGRQLNDLFGTHYPSMDHWRPIKRGGGSTPDNMIPLCHGKGGCNNRKNANDPVEWVKREFKPKQAQQILDRINTYFKWVKSQPTE